MEWIWFSVTGVLCLVGTYWILSGQDAQQVQSALGWFVGVGGSEELTTYPLPNLSLGLPISLQAAFTFAAAGSVGYVVSYLPTARRMMMLMCAILTGRLLLWRLAEGLIAQDAITTLLSIMLFVAEFTAFSSLMLSYWQTWVLKDCPPKHVPLPIKLNGEKSQVDLLIQVDRQALNLVYQTLIAARGIEWPEKYLWVLDAQHRLDVQALCKKLDIPYFTHPSGQILHHADATNYLLSMTQSQYVAVFQAGDLPSRQFLNELIPFFQDERMAFVQAATEAYNKDPLQRNLLMERITNSDSDLSIHVTQVGNDHHHLINFTGTGALFRREALQDVGGFERNPLHTSTLIQAKKRWHARYYHRILVTTSAPLAYGEWIESRLSAWQSRHQAFSLAFLTRGLSLSQRLCLLSLGLTNLQPWLRWVLLLLPVLSLVTGVAIIPASPAEICIYYVPAIIAWHFTAIGINRGVLHRICQDLYDTVDCLLPLSKPVQSPKIRDASEFHWRWVGGPVSLAFITLLASFIGITRLILQPLSAEVMILGLLWAFYNLVLLSTVILVGRERRQTRLSPRVPRQIRCLFTLGDGSVAIGQTVNISETGLECIFEQPIPTVGARSLVLLDWPEATELSVEVVHSVVETKNRHYIGLRILNRSEEQHHRLIQHLFGDGWPHRLAYTSLGKTMGRLMTVPFWITAHPEQANRRKIPRFAITLSCVLETEDNQYLVSFSDTISETGLSVILKQGHGIQTGQRLRVRIQWNDSTLSSLTTEVVGVNAILENDQLRLRFCHIPPDQQQNIIHQLYHAPQHLIRVAPALERSIQCYLKVPAQSAAITIRAISQEISEKGMVLLLQHTEGLQDGQALLMDVQWRDLDTRTYAIEIIALNPQKKMALVYFTDMNIDQLLSISQVLQAPRSEAPGFQPLHLSANS